MRQHFVLSLAHVGLFAVGLLALPAGSYAAECDAKSPERVNFSEHIAPLVYDKCRGCHRPNQAGPCNLLTYRDVSKRADTIQAVINDRYMPPWQPVAGFVEYAHERRLTDEQLSLLNRWIDAGCPEGDPAKLPAAPKFPDGWLLGTPDLVVTMKEPFAVPADGPDIYRSFVFPVALPEDKWVKAVELRPAARSAVHHALFFLDDSGTARLIDGQDGKPGVRGMGFRISGGLGGYVPGSTPTFLPDDLAIPLPKGSDIIMQTHFHPSGKTEVEQASLALYFADQPPSQLIVPIQVPPMFGRGMGIDIPAGKSNYTVRDTFQIPVDVEAISVGGHAHYICREMKMTATLPNGSIKTLLYIDDWDLDWQDRYLFKERVPLPAGTVLETTLIYDNSSNNPENPHNPPQRIRWGRESTDEMGSVTVMVVAAEKRDELTLQQSARRNALAGVGLFRRQPDDRQLISRAQDLPQLLKRLDKNGDGKLQRSEKPERVSDAFFDRFDDDHNGELDAGELQLVRKMVERLQAEERGTENPRNE